MVQVLRFPYMLDGYIIMLNKTIFQSTFSTFSKNKLLKQGLELTKFKLSLLNGIVTIGAYSLYPAAASCLPLLASTVALSMSSQSLNQYIEIQFDKKMIRTSQRPLVLGVNPKIALSLGIGLGIAGISGLYWYNPLTAAIGASIWSSYLFIYTKMKSRSQLNTFVGSIIGSLPVYLGWAASGRSICMIEPFAIFMYMMAWQHQHFYGIRWIYYDDYNNAGFKMQKDKKLASAQVLAQAIFSMVMVNYSLHYFGIMNCYLLGIPLSLGIYHWGIKSALAFSRQQITAKQFKMQSYKHFTLVFLILLLCGVMKRFEKGQNKVVRNQVITREEDLMNIYF